MKTHHEKARGCGYRKPGALYLIGSGEFRDCGRLPVPLETCPTCGQGLQGMKRPSRAQADRVNGAEILRSSDCVLAMVGDKHCEICPANEALIEQFDPAGLVWIGEGFYPTPDHWIMEAVKMGICRRIKALPDWFHIGKTWVLVAHRKAVRTDCPCQINDLTGTLVGGLGCQKCHGDGFTLGPGVFNFFLPSAVEYVVNGNETESELDGLERRGIEPVRVQEPRPFVRVSNIGQVLE